MQIYSFILGICHPPIISALSPPHRDTEFTFPLFILRLYLSSPVLDFSLSQIYFQAIAMNSSAQQRRPAERNALFSVAFKRTKHGNSIAIVLKKNRIPIPTIQILTTLTYLTLKKPSMHFVCVSKNLMATVAGINLYSLYSQKMS